MKPGTQFPVALEGKTVAYAVVEDVDGDVVTLIIPATRVRMGLRSSLVELTPEVDRILLDSLEDSRDNNSPASEEVSLRNQEFDTSALDV